MYCAAHFFFFTRRSFHLPLSTSYLFLTLHCHASRFYVLVGSPAFHSFHFQRLRARVCARFGSRFGAQVAAARTAARFALAFAQHRTPRGLLRFCTRRRALPQHRRAHALCHAPLPVVADIALRRLVFFLHCTSALPACLTKRRGFGCRAAYTMVFALHLPTRGCAYRCCTCARAALPHYTCRTTAPHYYLRAPSAFARFFRGFALFARVRGAFTPVLPAWLRLHLYLPLVTCVCALRTPAALFRGFCVLPCALLLAWFAILAPPRARTTPTPRTTGANVCCTLTRAQHLYLRYTCTCRTTVTLPRFTTVLVAMVRSGSTTFMPLPVTFIHARTRSYARTPHTFSHRTTLPRAFLACLHRTPHLVYTLIPHTWFCLPAAVHTTTLPVLHCITYATHHRVLHLQVTYYYTSRRYAPTAHTTTHYTTPPARHAHLHARTTHAHTLRTATPSSALRWRSSTVEQHGRRDRLRCFVAFCVRDATVASHCFLFSHHAPHFASPPHKATHRVPFTCAMHTRFARFLNRLR